MTIYDDARQFELSPEEVVAAKLHATIGSVLEAGTQTPASDLLIVQLTDLVRSFRDLCQGPVDL